ncbi:beta strand repeat-containing protein [Jannaschia helgolandensis]|uniref:Uncharacterized protein n=1 Tax=Jannaschia helgolandensis TaxID=188906 RepID=A0A1H7MIC2_9RHOB|nr:hypothetical protein [Jannaschia helgolandensis]SEL10819.1 hypothetical protein SAMN04488526_1945 [Jannaschia helgolandensis]
MKKFLTTTAIASALALPATAAHESTDVTQTVGALQAALNSIVINFDGTTVSQAATNAANLINYTADDLHDVLQTTDPSTGDGGLGQFAVNSLVSTGGFSGGVFTGAFDDVTQTATNVANSIEALNLEDLDQDLEATQVAINSISGPTGITSFNQTAVNAGNLATLDGVQNDLDQDVDDTVQTASNSAVSSQGIIVMGAGNSQSATNVVNSATIVGSVGNHLEQDVDDTLQDASNLLSNGGGESIFTFDQSAVNAANLATVDSLDDDVNQDVADLAQTASNAAVSTGGIFNGVQAATNVANSVTVAGAVDDDIIQSVSESGHHPQPVSQSASNVADADGDVGGMIQNAVNAANLATAASVGDNVDQYAYDLDQDADNLAFAFDGNINLVDQAATNVVNSLDIAGTVGGNVSQTLGDSSQTAGNTLDGVLSISNSTQAAVNAANLATLMTVGGDIDQTVEDVDQLATNEALLVIGSVAGNEVDPVTMEAIPATQEATNVANSVSAAGDGLEIETLDQEVIDATQIAANNIGASPIGGDEVTGVANVNQTAVNAANLATLQDVNVSLDQSVSGLGQLAINTVVDVDASKGGISDLTQAATNVANSATLDDVEASATLTQTADMTGFLNGQAALNYVEFGKFGVTTAAQTATNAVNLATLDALRGTLSQEVINGAQIAGNLVNYSGSTGSAPFFDSAGTVSGLTQTAVNAANLVTVKTLPDLGGLEVSQSYSGFQLAGNGLYDADTINNVTQAATNVANSISNPPPSVP